MQAGEERLGVCALLGLAPDPPVIPGQFGLHGQAVSPITTSQERQHLEAQIGPLAHGGDADHAEGELDAGELGSRELRYVDPIGNDDDAVDRPAGALGGQLRVEGAHADDLVDGVDAYVGEPACIELEAVQSHDQALSGPLVAAIPDDVRPGPLADDDIRPFREVLAHLLVVRGQTAPRVESHLDSGHRAQVVEESGEELQVVARDTHAQGAVAVGQSGRLGREGAGQEPGKAIGGGHHAEGLGAGRCRRKSGGVDRRLGHHLDDSGDDVVLVGDEERIVLAEEVLVHRCAVEQSGYAKRTEFQDLRRQFETGVHLRGAPGEAEIGRCGELHRRLPRHAAVPHHSGAGLQRLAHASRPVRVIGDVMDLVADHVEFSVDSLLGQQRRQAGHGQGVPQGCELAGVDELDRGCSPFECWARGQGECRFGNDRAPQHGPAAGGGHHGLEQVAQFLGLAEHEAAGLSYGLELLEGLGSELERGLRDVGEVGPQAARQ